MKPLCPHPWRGLPLAAALLLGAVDGVEAQFIHGTVRDPQSGVPVAGALVRVVTTPRRPYHSFLTGPDGVFRVRVDSAGSYSLSVQRIGYEAVVDGPFHVESPGVALRHIAPPQQAIALDGLVVEPDRRSCALGDDHSGATQAVWDQIQTALAAARWTEDQGEILFMVNQRQRRLSADDATVLESTQETVPVLGSNSVHALPVEELARDGYVRTAPSGEIEYFGPDAEILLSESFLDGHCFSLREGEGADAGLLGLRFEPEGEVVRPDIAGTLWLDRTTARLDRIDFGYVALPHPVAEGLAGGEVRYVELPNGRWIVRDWTIRVPAVAVAGSRRPDREARRYRVTELYEKGAEVAYLEQGTFQWSPSQATHDLAGAVTDSTRGAGLAGAGVSVAGRGWRTSTGNEGRFRIANLTPGRYRVVVEHPRLDSLGLAPLQADVEVGPDASKLALAVPSWPTLLASQCAPGEGALVGRVVDGAGAALEVSARVTVVPGSGGPTRSTVSRTDGWWVVCGLPPGPVRARAVLALSISEEVPSTVPDSGFAKVTLTLPDLSAVARIRSEGEADDRSGEGVVVRGRVRDAASGRPVASALLELRTLDGELRNAAVTDAEGRYALAWSASALDQFSVHARSLGYQPLVTRPLTVGRRAYEVDVDLAPDALEIEGVVVTAEAVNPILEDVGFYERKRRMTGLFFDKIDLDLPRHVDLSDALLRVPAITTVATSGGPSFLQFRRRGVGTVRNQCIPAIYLDGAIVRHSAVSYGTPHGLVGQGGGEYRHIDELIRAYDIEGIELYDGPASGPAQFTSATPPCGSIVLWTTRGIR